MENEWAVLTRAQSQAMAMHKEQLRHGYGDDAQCKCRGGLEPLKPESDPIPSVGCWEMVYEGEIGSVDGRLTSSLSSPDSATAEPLGPVPAEIGCMLVLVTVVTVCDVLGECRSGYQVVSPVQNPKHCRCIERSYLRVGTGIHQREPLRGCTHPGRECRISRRYGNRGRG
jgi:hypothetical protein